jgi:hypothetical protein
LWAEERIGDAEEGRHGSGLYVLIRSDFKPGVEDGCAPRLQSATRLLPMDDKPTSLSARQLDYFAIATIPLCAVLAFFQVEIAVLFLAAFCCAACAHAQTFVRVARYCTIVACCCGVTDYVLVPRLGCPPPSTLSVVGSSVGTAGEAFLAMMALGTVVWFAHRPNSRRPPSICPTCGYDTRACVNRCSECGYGLEWREELIVSVLHPPHQRPSLLICVASSATAP